MSDVQPSTVADRLETEVVLSGLGQLAADTLRAQAARIAELEASLNRDGRAKYCGDYDCQCETCTVEGCECGDRLRADAAIGKWVAEQLSQAARPCGPDEEMNEAEQTEQAYASMLLARVDRKRAALAAAEHQQETQS